MASAMDVDAPAAAAAASGAAGAGPSSSKSASYMLPWVRMAFMLWCGLLVQLLSMHFDVHRDGSPGSAAHLPLPVPLPPALILPPCHRPSG